jgi:hypothetical protein
VVDVLFRQGRSSLSEIRRQTRLPERVLLEALTVLVQHSLVRWAAVEDGIAETVFYECFFDDIYPLVRYGKEIQLTEKHTGQTEA